MPRVRMVQIVDASPEAVFRLYVDASRLAEWQPGLRGIRDVTGALDEVGTTYTLDQPGPRLRVRVMRVERPSLHQQIERLAWYGWELTVRFDPLPGDRTRLTFEASYELPPPLGWLLGPLVALSGWWFGRTEVRRLKMVAERDHAQAIAAVRRAR